MARPKKIGLDYFPHDCDASGDEKLEPIEALFGNDGYAVYFKLLERIYRAGGVLDFSDPDTPLTLAKKCNLTIERFNEILKKMLDKDLFIKNDFVHKKVLTSEGIKKRMSPIRGKRLKWLKKKKKVFSGENSDNGEVFSGENPPETPERKVKKSKVKEIIKDRDIGGAPPEKKETPRTSPGLPEQEKAFKQFWENYPARNGKKLEEQETFRRFCLVPQEDWPQLIQATKHYAASEAVTDGIGIKDPKNFIGDQATERSFWKEWIKPEIKAPQGASNAHKSNPQSTRTQAGGIRGEASAYDANIIRFDEGEDGDPGG